METETQEQPPEPASPMLQIRNKLEKPLNAALQAIGNVVHPNHITASRVPLTVAAIGLDQVSHIAGATVYAITTLIDWLDGAVARSSKGKETKEGTLLDPFIDKVANFTALSYQIGLHADDIAFTAAAIASMSLNAVSQVQRGDLAGQAADIHKGILAPDSCEPVKEDGAVKGIKANTLGKIKQMFECAAITGMFAAGEHDEMRIAAAAALIASSLFSLAGTLRRYTTQ